MRRFSLRTRLAAGAVAAIAVAVVLLGVAVLARLDAQLADALDGALRDRAVEVARLAATTPAVLDQPGSLEGRLGGSSLFVQVVDPRGRLVARSSGLGSRVLPDGGAARAALVERRAGYGDDALGDEPVRIYAAPLGELGRGPAAGGAVIVAGTKAEIETTLDTTRRFVVIGALAAAVVAGLLATLLAAGALRPLRRLSAGARTIERSGDASARLPIPVARDEVGELAGTLNGMLASLERAREAEQRFVGDASHELRTPLTALRGNVDYLVRHGADREVLDDVAGRRRAAQRAARRPARARPRGRLGARPRRAGRPRRARARGGVRRARRPARRRSTARRSCAARRRRSSARSATSCATRASTGRAGGGIDIAAGGDGRVAWISVADEGPGLAPEEAARAFERFWRGSGARGEGSGLGLAIVRAIAERHGGRVSVDGARFTIELPALKEVSRPARRTAGHETTNP